MPTLDEIVDQLRAAAGADFAFALTLRGRLVTRNAPRDMPEAGRMNLAAAARMVGRSGQVAVVTVPREELVPFGGAAPVDVYVGLAGEQAAVCAALATWADKGAVLAAMAAAVRAVDAVLGSAGLVRRRRRSDPGIGPAEEGKPGRTRRSSAPPAIPARAAAASDGKPAVKGPGRGPVIWGALPAPGGSAPSIAAMEREARRAASAPQITIAEAPLGRASLAAIDEETRRGGGSIPHLTVGEATLGRESLAAVERELREGSAPRITLGEAALGRESLAAIERDARQPATSLPDRVRVQLESVAESEVRATPNPDSPRLTQPWVESPADSLRATDAAKAGRKSAPPRLTVKLAEADAEVLDAARMDRPPSAPPGKRRR